jgi:GxxExxY protein
MESKEDKATKRKLKNIQFSPVSPHTEEVAKSILDSAYQIHTMLGGGLLEPVYEASCLIHELNLRKTLVQAQLSLPVIYKGIKVDFGDRRDILADDCVIVEIRSTENISPAHCA